MGDGSDGQAIEKPNEAQNNTTIYKKMDFMGKEFIYAIPDNLRQNVMFMDSLQSAKDIIDSSAKYKAKLKNKIKQLEKAAEERNDELEYLRTFSANMAK